MKPDISKLSNLNQRIIAGLSGAIIMVTSICFSNWSFFVIFFLICLLSLREFYNILFSAGIKPNSVWGMIAGMSVYTFVFLIEKQLVDPKFYYLLLPLIFLLFPFELFRKLDNPFQNIAFSILGIIYIAIPFALLSVSGFQNGEYNYKFILGIVLLIWANDIGGYIFGVLMGKTKLFPRISPKKTWEGTLGGGFFALGISIGLSYFFPDLDLIHWIALAIIIAITGSYGDLAESLLKRSLAIKDSAQSIPGHGGFLDRFDALLLASPFVAAYLELFTA